MNLTFGLALLCLGSILILFGRPRKGEDIRPYLRRDLARITYISVILTCAAFVVMISVTSL